MCLESLGQNLLTHWEEQAWEYKAPSWSIYSLWRREHFVWDLPFLFLLKTKGDKLSGKVGETLARWIRNVKLVKGSHECTFGLREFRVFVLDGLCPSVLRKPMTGIAKLAACSPWELESKH